MTPAATFSPPRRRRIPFARPALVIACALAVCTCAWAQGGGWAAVEGIAPGSTVKVELSRAKTVTGMLTGASASGMEVQTSEGATRHLDRAQIKKVYLVGKFRKLRDGLIGSGAGAAGGAALGYALGFDGYDYNGHTGLPYHADRRASTAALGALVIGAIGAAVGALIGSRRSKALVYRRGSAGLGAARTAAARGAAALGPAPVIRYSTRAPRRWLKARSGVRVGSRSGAGG